MKPLHEVIDETLRVYTLVLPQTFLPAALGALAGGIPMAMVTADMGQPPDLSKMDWSAFGWAWALQLVVSALVQGTLLKLIAMRVRNGVELPLAEALHAGMAMLPTMLVATVIYAVLSIALTFALVLPGIWMLIVCILYAPAIALEGRDALGSLQRSRALLRGAWWRTFGLMLVTALVVMLGYLLLATFVTPLANAAFGGGWPTEAALATLVGALFTPLINALLVVLFLDYAGREPGAAPAPPPGEIAA